MGEIILRGDENDINAALNESLQSAVVGNIGVSGTRLDPRRLDRILVVGTSALDHTNETSIPVEEIEIEIEDFDKYVSIDTTPISKVCRACLCEKPNMHSLYDTWDAENIAEMLTSFAAVQLTYGDGLPESVCGECAEQVGKCFSFKQLCERSESVLRCLVAQALKEEGTLLAPLPPPPPLHPVREVKPENVTEIIVRGLKTKDGTIEYDEYMDDDFHGSTSPLILSMDAAGGHDSYHTTARPLTSTHQSPASNPPKKILTVTNNPPVVIDPDYRFKNNLRKGVPKQRKFLSKVSNRKILTESVSTRQTVLGPRKIKPLKFPGEIKIEEQDVLEEILNNSDNSFQGEIKAESLDFQCYSCGKGFANQRKLSRHERIHLNVKPFQCDICQKGFTESGDLRRHVRKHSAGSRRGRGAQAEGRQEAEAGGGERVPCPHCHLTFGSEGDLRIHSSVHLSAEGPAVCRHCDKKFETTMQLKRHVRTHLLDKPHKCRICHKGFPEMGSLTRHFRRHTGETRERKHICTRCGKAYFDRHSLNIHERKHTGERPWICSECGKGFIDSRLLNSHMKIHSDHKPHACKHCDKSFKHESTLTTHIRTHTGEKPFICTVCGNAFVQSSNLSLHMRTHTREKPYGCELCGKKFSSSSALTTHRRVHTGEKPYHCKICQRRFARHDMTAHMRMHTGERPFVCSVCSKGCSTLGQLQQHTRIHTGERPFTCVICRKGCATSSYLKKHLLRSHNVTSTPALLDQSGTDLPDPSAPQLKKLLKKSKTDSKDDNPDLSEEIKQEATDVALQDSSQVINVGSAVSLSRNTLNFVAVANNNGELSIIRQQTANDLKMVTLTADSSGHIGTIITNTHMSQEKLFQIDPNVLRFTSGQLVPGQVAISEVDTECQ